MSNCSCSPLPSPSCGPLPSPTPECGRIRMFMGYKTKPDGKPGELEKLYYTEPVDSDSIKNGFTIGNYSAKPLLDAKIIPSLGLSSGNSTFTLTERELLACSTWEGWLAFCAEWKVLTNNPAPTPFGILCMEGVGVNMDDFRLGALRMFASLDIGDTSPFVSRLWDTIIQPLNIKYGTNNYYDEDDVDCKNLARGQIVEKLKVCWEWLKNIHDTYYGTQFLIKVVGRTPQDTYIPGICIKDENGKDVSLIINSGAFYIEGDGSSQGFYTSDEVADGGFPKEDATDILGLTRIDWTQNTDGKISAFAKIGKISDADAGKCSELAPNRKLYYRFTDHKDDCIAWNIDLSKLSPENYYIQPDDNTTTVDQILYIKCDVENRFYIDTSGIYVNVRLLEKVPLTLTTGLNPIQGIVNWAYLISGFKDLFYNFLNKSKDVSGSRGNSTQLNLALSKDPCVIPEGFVIPFKSNVYNYGPYYYVTDPDDGGGIDVITEQTIAPWNFIQPGEFKFPVKYPYCAMDNFGKELAKLTPKGLQKLEKGRATVVGLPCHDLGKSLNTSGYDNNKEVGPTLLTDINVEYGAGGFNTTYNFSTYSPRLGKSEKYLLEAWSDNIKNTQYINSYLRNEKDKANNIKKDYNKKLIDKNYFFQKFSTPKIKENSTPNRLIFSGYYFSTTDTYVPTPSDYPAPSPSVETVVECNPSASPKSLKGSLPELNDPSASAAARRYTFAESDNGYSAEFIQTTYFQLAGMSMDGLYLPVSLLGVGDAPDKKEYDTNFNRKDSWENKGRLPRFAMRCEFDETFIEWFKVTDGSSDLDKFDQPGYPIPTKTRDEIPPFKLKLKNNNTQQTDTLNCYLLPIHQRYLNPYTTASMLSGDGGVPGQGMKGWGSRLSTGSSKGFVISSIVFGQQHIDYQISHTNEESTLGGLLAPNKTDEFIRQKQHNFRVPALRGPLVLQGWGYDTTGKPIPNQADHAENTQLGRFKKSQLTDKFQKNWLQNPKSWPVGPIDLRFDRERGVWTCPSPNKIIVARLKEKLCPGGSAKAELINPEAAGIKFYEKYNISGPDGQDIRLNMSSTEITVYDFIGETIDRCAKIYVYYDDNRYIVLSAKSSSNPIVRFRHIKLCDYYENGSGEDPSAYYGLETWGAYAGYGDKYYNYHSYGIRIDCDGNPIDADGERYYIINEEDEKEYKPITLDIITSDPKQWLIKIYDNAGKFGPSYGRFENTENAEQDESNWKDRAATGYAILTSNDKQTECINPSVSPSASPEPELECTLGSPLECSDILIDITDNEDINKELEQYDILFLESYARFIECELTQDLYVTQEEAEDKYSDDDYKKANPEGNATANILTEPYTEELRCYGDSPNGKDPLYVRIKDNKYEFTDFRVFDPFKDADEDLNPFKSLKYGDRVLVIFDERTKKYLIWQSLNKNDKVIKFGLVSDKNVSDVEAMGVIVDQYGRPLDKKGNLIKQQEDFAANFITIRDPFVSRTQLAPAPNNGNLGPNLTAFGPALGSNILAQHYNGIPLAGLGGGYGNEEKMPPFLGFALQRTLPNEENEPTTIYEMFQLEHYARYVKGKICTKTASFNFNAANYYLATIEPVGGFREGIRPIGRNTGALPRGNLVIFHPLDQFTGVHSFIGGDLIDGALGDSSHNKVDGCEFIALLDSAMSTTNLLIYNIVESERFALEGKIRLKSQAESGGIKGAADNLNENNFKVNADLNIMETEWYQGFIWNRVNSETNFELISIFNREEWINKGLFITGSVITVYLKGYDANGNPQYNVDNGGTIARVVQRYISSEPGLFGLPEGLGGAGANDRKIDDNDDFMDGLDPSVIDNNNKPIIDMSDDQQWMTYDQGIVTGLWDETLDANGEVKNCKYKIIYAQEVPVVITAKAKEEFKPENLFPVLITPNSGLYPTCQGSDRDPMGSVFDKVENPMGYGAKAGDFVTIQRVFVGEKPGNPFNLNTNYRYIVIGTGHPPGDLK